MEPANLDNKIIKC